ncbi:MAG: OsmC family protein [Propionibacteriaceae bacterium]|nr:OsmC family protein [Propionibacteriaceae bacterium]
MTGSPAEAPAGADVWAERVGPRTYVGYSPRGAAVAIGPDLPDGFWPGELLKLALAGCAGMSSDEVIARRLGADYHVTIGASGTKHSTEDRFTALEDHLVLDLSGLSAEDKARLRKVVDLAIASACTIGHTLTHGAQVTTDIV